MDVKGEHQFDVSAQQLWNYLMDIDVLAKITPGVSKLEVIEKDKYKTVSEIKIGPVKGSFKGNLEVVDKVEPDSFAIVMEQLSKIGNAHVKVDMQLKQNGATASVLNFDGKAKLSGVIARTGQRVLSGVANKITKEVFASLEEHIQEDQKSNPVVTEIEVQETLVSETVVGETVVNTPVVEEGISEEKIVNIAEVEVIEEITPDGVTSEVASKNETIAKVKAEVKEVISESIDYNVLNPNESRGLFSGIINFFKRLIS